MNLHQMLSMGGFGKFVWSSYFIMLSVFSLNIYFAIRERKEIKKIYSLTRRTSNQ